MHGSRLRFLRESKNISQYVLAKRLGVNINEIKHMERNMTFCCNNKFFAIKRILDADFLPLLDSEFPAFRERLYIWRDLIRNRKIDEAKELQRKIADVVVLDVEIWLIWLYRMFEITLCIVQGDFDEATKKLDAIEVSMLDAESRYYYYRNKAAIKFYNEEFEDALTFFNQALEIGKSEEHILEDDESIYFNIASCYHSLHLPNHAIRFLDDSGKTNSSDRTSSYSWQIDCTLAVNYIRTNQLPEAEELLKKCLTHAEALGDRLLTAIALHNYGFLHQASKYWLLAIHYYSRSSEFFVQGSAFHLENLYQQCRCQMEVGKFIESTQLLESAKAYLVLEDNPHLPENKLPYYDLLFKTLYSLMLIINKDTDLDEVYRAAEYIEATAIVFLCDINEYTCVLDYCEVLDGLYTKAEKYEKVVAIKTIAMDLYKKMLYYRRK